ncbi:MAG: dTDP-4-amino-4,6-dideoxygalactose transaminase [Chitinophagales bacterium]
MIPFNIPVVIGREIDYLKEALANRKLSGDGPFTKKCSAWFEHRYQFKKTFLTTSCTDALELCALLCELQPGDEVLIPSYTFVSTANPFVLRGAKLVFADSMAENPNIDVQQLESLITPRTKAIALVHYAGIACDMDAIMALAKKHNLLVVEDAAQAIDSFHNGKPLGSIGHLSAFSFHETKNIVTGEGGMAVINDERFKDRAEIIREKGTNRSRFFRGEVDKYGWVDVGSSFLPSELIAAYLMAQLEALDTIQEKRKAIWQVYWDAFQQIKGKVQLPYLPSYATNNAHMFYLGCESLAQRTELVARLKSKNIHAVFHYLSLHQSEFYKDKHDGRDLPNADRWTDVLLRLPLYYDLTLDQASMVAEEVVAFFK